MTTKAKPSTGQLDGAKIGTSGDTFKLIANEISGVHVNPLLDTTGDGDSNNQYSGPGSSYVDNEIEFRGWMVGSSVFGFANLGASDTGVAVTITLETGHTLAGNIVVEVIRWTWRKKAQAIPIAFRAKVSGALTEAYA